MADSFLVISRHVRTPISIQGLRLCKRERQESTQGKNRRVDFGSSFLYRFARVLRIFVWGHVPDASSLVHMDDHNDRWFTDSSLVVSQNGVCEGNIGSAKIHDAILVFVSLLHSNALGGVFICKRNITSTSSRSLALPRTCHSRHRLRMASPFFRKRHLPQHAA